ncbi:hypothetical protein SPD48_09620 [Pseudogracilibacillus sp. SE30717A]|uniref:hypothetical protein n=1 Tax=Pseudogracilibacillus sp. SE30717A TaxID=3098293 RepID=UPI00300E4909
MQECYIKDGEDLIEAEFIGIYQHSRVIEPSPMLGGHPGGVIAHPIALVRVNNRFRQVNPFDVVMVEED